MRFPLRLIDHFTAHFNLDFPAQQVVGELPEPQYIVPLGIDPNHMPGNQLPQHCPPLLIIEILADSPGTERIMAAGENPLGFLADKHINHMLCAEACP